LDLEFAADAPASDIADCVFRNGVALVRGHYDRALIAAIAARAAERYAAEADRVRRGEQEPNRFRAVSIDEIEIDGRPAAELLVDDLARLVAGLCLDTLQPAVRQSWVRCSEPGHRDLELPFHQDSRILNAPLVNLWIPLSDCGRDIPGLEIVTRRIDGLIATLPHDPTRNFYAGHGLEIDPDIILAAFADALWHPEFKAGDVLMFRGTTVHRTHVTPTMAGERMSIDLRMVAPDLPA